MFRQQKHSFDELRAAITAHEKVHIARLILEDNPDNSLFLGTDEKNNNVLHLASQYCVEEDASIISMIIAYLNKIHSLSLASTTNAAGETPLHLVTQFNSLVAMGEIIEAMGEKVNAAARMYDNAGHLPITSLFERKDVFKLSMIKPLLNSTFQNPFGLSLNAKIDANSVIKNYSGHSPKLIANLKIACDVVNQARSIIKISGTHPDDNKASPEKQIEVRDIISDKIRFFPSDSEEYVSAIKEYKTGNCSEFVVLALHMMRCHPPRVGAEYFYLTGKTSDDHSHAFIVLDRLPDSDPLDYSTWGPNAVICDPWAGKVYPAFEIPTKMSCHFSLPLTDESDKSFRVHNIIGLYNPAFHEIKPENSSLDISYVAAREETPSFIGNLANSLWSFFTEDRNSTLGQQGQASSHIKCKV